MNTFYLLMVWDAIKIWKYLKDFPSEFVTWFGKLKNPLSIILSSLLLCFFLTAYESLKFSDSNNAYPPNAGIEFSTSRLKPSPDSGILAYIGTDGNVYVTSVNPAWKIAVTSDATAGPERFGFSYHRVSWSPEGSLAYASVDRSLHSTQSQLFVTDNPENTGRVVGESDEHFVIYIYWSPVPCQRKSNCSDLAYLIEEPEGIALRKVGIDPDRITNERIGIGGPVYFSWSPEGSEIVWHSGGAQRFDSNPKLVHYHIEKELTTPLIHSPGKFLAPAWSPVSNSWLAATYDGLRSTLQWFTNEQMTALASAENRWLSFVWSPNGKKIAYAISEDAFMTAFGPVYVYDLETGETQQITGTFSIASFFWSPVGDRLAYLTRPAYEGEMVQWRVFDLAGNEDHGYEMFLPSYQMVNVINSFNQYAQSHRFWSPDGRYLVYADRDSDEVQRVWLIDTWASNSADPIFIDEGTIGVWSWN